MDIKYGRKKSFDVEFVEVTEDNIDEAAAWAHGKVKGEGRDRFIKIYDKNAINVRQTQAYFGDFLVRSVGLNTFKVFNPKVFARSFEESTEVAHSEHEVARDASTGQFVTDKYAEENPDTTVHETVEVHQGP